MDKPTIQQLLLAHLSRDLVLNVEELLETGAQRAFGKAKGMNDGHLPSVVGQLRHFHMNEGFAAALEGSGAFPTPIKGNSLVTGRAGIFQLGRFNLRQGPWYNARRSAKRRVMAQANAAIEPLVQGGLFDSQKPITTGSVFFVCIFSASLEHGEKPMSIEIAVPNQHMTDWLFHEPVSLFVQRYNDVAVQDDRAVPMLKTQQKTGSNPEGT
ncbi:hypothetical protein [Dyella sp.]|uniref:hypothetical protein n=1 Tax=Dyella sp. TaxID=1869338 RepID=UPI002ED54ABF